jgi:hypothetical protein
MNEAGCKATLERCAAKYKALRASYKACVDNNNKSGSGRKTFEYFAVGY